LPSISISESKIHNTKSSKPTKGSQTNTMIKNSQKKFMKEESQKDYKKGIPQLYTGDNSSRNKTTKKKGFTLTQGMKHNSPQIISRMSLIRNKRKADEFMDVDDDHNPKNKKLKDKGEEFSFVIPTSPNSDSLEEVPQEETEETVNQNVLNSPPQLEQQGNFNSTMGNNNPNPFGIQIAQEPEAEVQIVRKEQVNPNIISSSPNSWVSVPENIPTKPPAFPIFNILARVKWNVEEILNWDLENIVDNQEKFEVWTETKAAETRTITGTTELSIDDFGSILDNCAQKHRID